MLQKIMYKKGEIAVDTTIKLILILIVLVVLIIIIYFSKDKIVQLLGNVGGILRFK